MYIPLNPTPGRRPRVPLREYLAGLLRYPARTLSEIALDKPWLRGGSFLLAGLALFGASLGDLGLPGALARAVLIPGVVAVAFGLVSLVLFGMAKYLEGEGSYMEMVSALVFALLPLLFLAPAGLLRLVPGRGDFLSFLAWLGIVGWCLRLVYLALRESHRFTGTQALLTMTIPVAIGGLTTFLGFIVAALVLIAL